MLVYGYVRCLVSDIHHDSHDGNFLSGNVWRGSFNEGAHHRSFYRDADEDANEANRESLR